MGLLSLSRSKIIWRSFFVTLGAFSIVNASEFTPKLRWAWVSEGTYFDQWGSQGWLNYREKNVGTNPPQTLNSVQAGMKWGLGSHLGVTFALPYFYNQTSTYRFHPEVKSVQGLGDPSIKVDWREKIYAVGLQVFIPGPYEAQLEPWTGFNVWRLGIPLEMYRDAHYAYINPTWVFYSPSGANGGTVDPFDLDLNAGYNYSHRLNSSLKLRGGLDYGYSSYHFLGNPKTNRAFSLDPVISLALTKGWQHELAVSVGATVWSVEHGEFAVYGSKKVFVGVYYGFYR